MRIEDEIKQKSFQNEYHKLIVNLKFTSNWLGSFHNKILKSHGISAQQFNVLRILKGQYPKPSSLILIRERMLDRDSNASRLIDKLEAAGLTKRVQCPKDRRQVDITITESGLALLEAVNPQLEDLTNRLINLEESEAKTMNDLLDKMRSNSSEEILNESIEHLERSNT